MYRGSVNAQEHINLVLTPKSAQLFSDISFVTEAIFVDNAS